MYYIYREDESDADPWCYSDESHKWACYDADGNPIDFAVNIDKFFEDYESFEFSNDGGATTDDGPVEAE